MFSILNRTILWELFKVFGLALFSITGILLLAGIVAEASQKGLAPHQILLIIPLIIPSTLPYTLPATTLFACCVVYGRLAADNEVLAVRAAGVHILRILLPAFILGGATTVVTAGLYHSVIPTTFHTMRSIVVNDIEGLLYGMLKREGRIDFPNMEYVIYVKRVQGRKLIDAQFMHRDVKNQRYDVIARAKEAELLVDLAHNQVLVHMRYCIITGPDGDAHVDAKTWPVDLPKFPTQGKYRPREMTWNEMLERRGELLGTLEMLREEISLKTARTLQNSTPEALEGVLQNLRYEQGVVRAELRSLEAELHMRPALAVGCFCFVLIACPVGIWFSRSDYLSSFVTCFLPIVFLYYPLLLCGLNLGKAGTLNPALGAWAANTGMLVIALLLYRKLLQN